MATTRLLSELRSKFQCSMKQGSKKCAACEISMHDLKSANKKSLQEKLEQSYDLMEGNIKNKVYFFNFKLK